MQKECEENEAAGEPTGYAGVLNRHGGSKWVRGRPLKQWEAAAKAGCGHSTAVRKECRKSAKKRTSRRVARGTRCSREEALEAPPQPGGDVLPAPTSWAEQRRLSGSRDLKVVAKGPKPWWVQPWLNVYI